MIQTNRGPMTVDSLMDELTFSSYRANREKIEPEGFKRMGFPNVDAYEARWQAEQAIIKAAS